MSKKTNSSDVYKSFLGSKKEGQGFADKRKRKTAYEYLKHLQKEKRKEAKTVGNVLPKHKPLAFLHSHLRNPEGNTKGHHAFSAAEKTAKKKQEAREKQRQETQQVKVEKTAALTAYQERKKTHHLKLCKRTSKGQPVMKFQMEVLLDKIMTQKGLKS